MTVSIATQNEGKEKQKSREKTGKIKQDEADLSLNSRKEYKPNPLTLQIFHELEMHQVWTPAS